LTEFLSKPRTSDVIRFEQALGRRKIPLARGSCRAGDPANALLTSEAFRWAQDRPAVPPGQGRSGVARLWEVRALTRRFLYGLPGDIFTNLHGRRNYRGVASPSAFYLSSINVNGARLYDRLDRTNKIAIIY
jgi:hypothetical protein